ncbi:beta-galactosidase [Kosmotoga arenicorallina S304]|uniref:Beta-galactosidase n=1 Tax=Kosmotoga arenicorallina S304 TaxID=1453497 RepID=A0A176K1H6_9BACT|nr:beta-galactosidase BgaS [Kosmotoga arenicorallina]OAA30738.1 beta-galactosidase [Kosmotoga arenicorallina S304]
MFSEDFLFGASMSGFQFEMGDNAVDSNTDWFLWVHDPLLQENGVVSGDLPEKGLGYWERYPEVHELAIESGFNALRIGIEWSRIFPVETFGAETLEELKEIADYSAIERYREILIDIRNKGMKTMVNLNHFTLPLWLHDPIKINRNADFTKSGWLDERSPHEFAKFSAFIVRELDEVVDFWSTMNEPNVVANLGYFQRPSGFPPSLVAPKLWKKALDNEIKAHRLSYEAMREYTAKPIGVIYAFHWIDGDDSATEANNLINWYFMDAVSEKADYIGINYYTRTFVKRREQVLRAGEFEISWRSQAGYGFSCEPNTISKEGLPVSDAGWEIYPLGLYNMTKAICERYKKPVYITENGIADDKDALRPYYLISHLATIEKLLEEGYDIRGYLHWSLTDNYEWARGFSLRFGLVHVDYDKGILTPRPSFFLYREIIKSRTTKRFSTFLNAPFGLWK